MARKPMVSRAFESMKLTLLVVNTESGSCDTTDFVLPRVIKGKEKILKAVKQMLETETLKVVDVKSAEIEKTLYGMPEEQFLASAVKLDPETRRPIEQ